MGSNDEKTERNVFILLLRHGYIQTSTINMGQPTSRACTNSACMATMGGKMDIDSSTILDKLQAVCLIPFDQDTLIERSITLVMRSQCS